MTQDFKAALSDAPSTDTKFYDSEDYVNWFCAYSETIISALRIADSVITMRDQMLKELEL